MQPPPSEYDERIHLKNGTPVLLRPIRTGDGPLILDIFSRLSPESVFFRFLTHLERLPSEMLYHLVHIDYEKDFALAASIEEKGRESLIAVCRYFDHGEGRAELTIAVRDDYHGQGLGKAMVSRVVGIAKAKGYTRVEIILDSRNENMKKLFSGLGYPFFYHASILDICDRMEIDLTRENPDGP